MPKLKIVVTSTREQRGGEAVATWFAARAAEHRKFDVEVLDLQTIALPMLDEPNHPNKRQYTHDHTKAWSAKIDEADAFVFVTPEYNYGMPPALLNAIDYLYHEWTYKPAAFVSYGGVSGGTRSVQMAKQVLTAVKVMPLPEQVTLPLYAKQLANGVFDPGDLPVKSATGMLDELLRWATALKAMRA